MRSLSKTRISTFFFFVSIIDNETEYLYGKTLSASITSQQTYHRIKLAAKIKIQVVLVEHDIVIKGNKFGNSMANLSRIQNSDDFVGLRYR